MGENCVVELDSACVKILRTRLLKDAFVSLWLTWWTTGLLRLFTKINHFQHLHLHILQSTSPVTNYSILVDSHKFQNRDQAHKKSLIEISSGVRRMSVGCMCTDGPGLIPYFHLLIVDPADFEPNVDTGWHSHLLYDVPCHSIESACSVEKYALPARLSFSPLYINITGRIGGSCIRKQPIYLSDQVDGLFCLQRIGLLINYLMSVSRNSWLVRVRLKRSRMGRMASLPPPMASIMRRKV